MHKKLTNGPLLDDNGQIIESGYATSLLKVYNRNAIKAARYRIKEWDYYLIHNQDYGIALTVADNSYIGALSVSLLDFREKSFITASKMLPLTFGKLKLPPTSASGDIVVNRKNVNFSFKHENGGRRLQVRFEKFKNNETFTCDLFLSHEPQDTMVIATPFLDDKKAFYYNQKINCMQAEGSFSIGTENINFKSKNTVALLDWGRGVWTFKNTWYWGSASGFVNDESFGFNIGYGFGDTSAASENMLFYGGKAHKLDQVTFHIPEKDGVLDYLSTWRFSSNDGRFEMNFTPILDRKDFVKVLIIKTDQHQVFGHYTGKAILDDGQILEIKDLLGFAERIENWW